MKVAGLRYISRRRSDEPQTSGFACYRGRSTELSQIATTGTQLPRSSPAKT
jgi:hypothetical protein